MHRHGLANLLDEVGLAQLAALRVPRKLLICNTPVEAQRHDTSTGFPAKGFFFTDGSANDPTKKELRAVAWAVVQISAIGCPTCTHTGLVPSDWGFDGTAFEGELFAVIH
eukprot:614497-Amphidinium_carterae.2